MGILSPELGLEHFILRSREGVELFKRIFIAPRTRPTYDRIYEISASEQRIRVH
jgi:hypothetical protein